MREPPGQELPTSNIRELDAGSLPDLLLLYRQLNEDDPPADLGIAQAAWEEIAANPRLKYYAAFLGEMLVSTCTLSIIPNLTRGCRPYGLIENVVTHRDFRRRGFGRQVLEHALQQAWQAGCYKVMLMTGRLDAATFAFYEAAGFDRHSKQAFVLRRR